MTDERIPEREPVPPPRHEGFLETAVSVISEPVPTMRRLTASPKTWWAVVLVAVLGLLCGLAAAAQVTSTPPDPRLDLGAGFTVAVMALAALIAPAALVSFLAIWTAFVHLSSMLLKGRASYAGLLSGFGFATVPFALAIPFQFIGAVAGVAGIALSYLISLAMAIWSLVLQVIAIRENYGFSTARAVGAFLIPLAVIFVLGVLLLFLFFALFLVAIPQR